MCRGSADGIVRVVKVVVVSFGCALIIHVACGRLIEMNILPLLIRTICQSAGASGCVTWVIKDAVSHAHAAVSEVVSAVRDRSTPEVY